MNDANNKKFFVNKIASNSEVLSAYRIYFILLDREEFYSEKDNKVFFDKVCNYFLDNSNDGKIGKNFNYLLYFYFLLRGFYYIDCEII